MNNALCPFCNSEPEIKVESHIVRTGRESSAQNIKLIEEVHHPRTGRLICYKYEQTQYIARCSNKNCIAHQLNKKFWTQEKAYEQWNKRREN